MEDVAELGVDDIITAVISHNASADALAWARVCGGAGRGCAVMLPEMPPAGAPSPPDLFGRVSSAELSQAASTMVGQRGGLQSPPRHNGRCGASRCGGVDIRLGWCSNWLAWLACSTRD